MFGYACKETPAFMPSPIYYSHKITKALSEQDILENLGWDLILKVKLHFFILI